MEMEFQRFDNVWLPFSLEEILHSPHLSTAVAWREKICKHFVFNKYFSLVLGVLKSKKS